MKSFLWILLLLYVGWLMWISYTSSKKVESEDSYATARKSYSWYVLGFMIPAIFASAGTFMGAAGMGYGMGFPVTWYYLGYPLGGYLGMVMFAKYARNMNKIGCRTIPEFFGERYQSSFLRIFMAGINILMLFYIGGQIVAGGTISELILDIPYKYGIWLTAGLVILYITFGGAHADVMGASLQGVVMTVIAILCLGLFIFTPGFEGGLKQVSEVLVSKDPRLGMDSLFFTGDVLYGSLLTCSMIFVAHFPYVFQPHFGVRFCSLNNQRDFPKAIIMASVIGTLFTVGAGLPGIFGRAVFDSLERADMVIPKLFEHFFPAPIAALVIIGILCACLSTVGGILLTFGQVFANDIYRRTLAPRMGHSEEKIEQLVKIISRICVVLAAIFGTLIVIKPPQYLTIFIWLGVGGFMSAISGPLLVGAVWRGATKAAAVFSTVFCTALYFYFVVIKKWSPMSTCGIIVLINIVTTFIISLFTPKFSDEHLEKFGFKKQLIGSQSTISGVDLGQN